MNDEEKIIITPGMSELIDQFASMKIFYCANCGEEVGGTACSHDIEEIRLNGKLTGAKCPRCGSLRLKLENLGNERRVS